jgi:predicted nuclease of restriction endonuclease-like RecB superfamily
MQLRIQSVSELTDFEREQLQQNMVWSEGSRWNDNHWCVTLENAAVKISMVVEQITEAMFDFESERETV